ncbi:MAG: transposase [Okeania sp. SIO2G4]|nr:MULTISPECIES: transposase [unclassified Okeania]NEP41955.1 transposase [Okeania sp. SIO2H7]NEP76161.1 transposase [Okeania sp. SIO2G5]NEP97060.1 transposase [Okeania sp. SIO2F5]NEQ95063.1 transposase [Okeania sp. SIO2G4]
MKIARLHRRVANIRKDGLHKLTTHLAKNHGSVVIEDLMGLTQLNWPN